MARNQRRRVQEALFSTAPSTTPPEEEKAAERTETPEKPTSSWTLNLSSDEKEELKRAFAALDSAPIRPLPPEERTEMPEMPIPGFKVDLSSDEGKKLEQAIRALDFAPIRPIPPEEHIDRTYGIEPNCTNVPRLLYAILCEVVRGRV